VIRKYRYLIGKNKISKFTQVGKMSTGSNICHTSVHVVGLFISYAFPLTFFLAFLLPYLSFPLRIDPLHFQVGCPKPGFSFFVLCCISFDW